MPFQLGAADTFSIVADFNLGELVSLELGHDSSGRNPEWFVESATVVDEATNNKWTFLACVLLRRVGCTARA